MNRRREERFRHRMGCQLELGGGRLYHGIVLNVSRSGLFVQTRARLPRAATAPIAVGFRSAASGEAATLSARVARQFWVPDQLVRLAAGGLGLRVLGDFAAWLELLHGLTERGNPELVGGEAAPPLRQAAPARCSECGRERTTLWSELCGWCSGKRPRLRGDRGLPGR